MSSFSSMKNQNSEVRDASNFPICICLICFFFLMQKGDASCRCKTRISKGWKLSSWIIPGQWWFTNSFNSWNIIRWSPNPLADTELHLHKWINITATDCVVSCLRQDQKKFLRCIDASIRVLVLVYNMISVSLRV